MTSELSRHDLYELTVQKPASLVPLLFAIHGGKPGTLGEDFSGTAALSREWIRCIRGGRAIAVDFDAEPLKRARRIRGLTVVQGDVRSAPSLSRHKADIVFVGNFSIGEIYERPQLVAYLRRTRKRLKRGGVFVCDTYGGESAFKLGAVQRIHPGPPSDPAIRIRYTWQQRKADPLTGMVENALHYRVERAGTIEHEITDAFVYHWRLWSVPELRDALREAGYRRTEVFGQLPDAVDSEGRHYARPIDDPADLDDSFIVCVAGRP